MVATVQTTKNSTNASVYFTREQLGQLSQIMPTMLTPRENTDDRIDDHFSGMITCNNATGFKKWIIDYGAFEHMTPNLYQLTEYQPAEQAVTITLHGIMPT